MLFYTACPTSVIGYPFIEHCPTATLPHDGDCQQNNRAIL